MKKQFKERYEKEKAAKQPLPVLQKICPQCGKEFQTNLINKKFCSQECQARHNREVKYVAPEWKKERECLFCCEPFIPTQPNQLLCSKKCREEHIALQNKLRYAEKVEELPVLHNLCPTNFKDGVCDTSAFDNLYKRASQGDYIHYADFNLGF